MKNNFFTFCFFLLTLNLNAQSYSSAFETLKQDSFVSRGTTFGTVREKDSLRRKKFQISLVAGISYPLKFESIDKRLGSSSQFGFRFFASKHIILETGIHHFTINAITLSYLFDDSQEDKLMFDYGSVPIKLGYMSEISNRLVVNTLFGCEFGKFYRNIFTKSNYGIKYRKESTSKEPIFLSAQFEIMYELTPRISLVCRNSIAYSMQPFTLKGYTNDGTLYTRCQPLILQSQIGLSFKF